MSDPAEIFEKIAPGEVYIISRSGDFLNVVENHDGTAVFRRVSIFEQEEDDA